MTDITKASQSCVVPIDETQAARTQKAVQNLKIERLSMGGSESSFEHCLSTSTCSSLKRERMNRLLGLFIAHLTGAGEGGDVSSRGFVRTHARRIAFNGEL